jgi:AraC family transcriptional regulator of adaptative response / methylphosphotriester-DNA alkyltransferase methyltransferase
MKRNVTDRQKEIAKKFLEEVDRYLASLMNGMEKRPDNIKDIAERLFIDPNHLSNTVRAVFGKSPCPVYEEKLIEVCKAYLMNTNKPIKFFKRYEQMTPSKFRRQQD